MCGFCFSSCFCCFVFWFVCFLLCVVRVWFVVFFFKLGALHFLLAFLFLGHRLSFNGCFCSYLLKCIFFLFVAWLNSGILIEADLRKVRMCLNVQRFVKSGWGIATSLIAFIETWHELCISTLIYSLAFFYFRNYMINLIKNINCLV